MGLALFSLVCGCGAFGAILLVASGLLRLAIAAANKSLGSAKVEVQPQARGGIPEWDWDDWDEESATELVPPWRTRGPIPEAGTLKCIAIAFLTALAYGFGFVVMGFAAQDFGFRMHREETRLAVAVLNLPVAGLALAVLLSLLLPTNFWRGGLVAFIFGTFIFAFCLFVGVPVLLLAVLAR